MESKDAQYVLRISDLEKRLQTLEQSSARGEWAFITGSGQPVLKPGEMWARSTSQHASWMEIATAWATHHIDLSGTNHPLWMIPDDGDPDTYAPDWLFGVETLAGDEITGSAFYQMRDAANTDTQLSWMVDVLRAEGAPPQAGDTVRAIFTPLSASGGDTDLDVYTRNEVDALLAGKLTKGSSDALALHNGNTLPQSTFHAKNTTNGGNYLLTANHVEVLKSDYHKKTNSTDVLLSNHTTVTQDSLKGKTYPGTFTASGSTLYWTP